MHLDLRTNAVEITFSPDHAFRRLIKNNLTFEKWIGRKLRFRLPFSETTNRVQPVKHQFQIVRRVTITKTLKRRLRRRL